MRLGRTAPSASASSACSSPGKDATISEIEELIAVVEARGIVVDDDDDDIR
jgi:hypothetical protein